MYIECRKPGKKREEDEGIAGMNMHFLNVMYNRWAVQNAVQLRQRIIERRGLELGLQMDESENAPGKRGRNTSRALAELRRTKK